MICPGGTVRVLSGRWNGRLGTFHGWTSRSGEPVCAEVDLFAEGRALARRVRVTTIGHTAVRVPASRSVVSQKGDS